MNEDYTVDVAVIWFVNGSKKCITKNNISVFNIFDLLSDKEITSIYLEKKCVMEKEKEE